MLKTDVALNYEHIPNDRHYRPLAQASDGQRSGGQETTVRS